MKYNPKPGYKYYSEGKKKKGEKTWTLHIEDHEFTVTGSHYSTLPELKDFAEALVQYCHEVESHPLVKVEQGIHVYNATGEY